MHDVYIKSFMKVIIFLSRYPARQLPSDYIMQMAQIIMGTGVKEKDAYHVASAMYAKCDYFLTTDKRLLKFKNSRIKMINPVVFVDEMEGRS